MKIVALMGKAGAGKDTILKKIFELYPDKFAEIVSCTTRPPREGEVDGVNYHFLTSEEFSRQLMDGEMLEATVFRDWCYGTSYNNLTEDKVNIGVYNPQGVRLLLDMPGIQVLPIYIMCDDKERLIRQLMREHNPDVKEIVRRYSADENDFGETYEDLVWELDQPPIVLPYNNTKYVDLDRLIPMIVSDIDYWAKYGNPPVEKH